MSKVTTSARKSLIWLGAIMIALFGLLSAGVLTGNTTWTPGLALDLAGGRQIILSPVLSEGSEETIEQSDLEQAVEVIRARVDATGVAEAEITTQGNNIVIGLPGNPSESVIDLVSQAAQLQFRPVLLVGDPGATNSGDAADPAAEPEVDVPTPESQPEVTAEPTAEPTATSPEPVVEPSPTASEVANTVTGTDASPEPTVEPAPDAVEDPAANPDAEPGLPIDPSSFEWLDDQLLSEYESLDCRDPANWAGRPMGDPSRGYAACAEFGVAKLAMGPVEVEGDDLANATSGPETAQTGTLTGRYEVRLQFNNEGTRKFGDVTTRLLNLEEPRNQFAIVLDGAVISYPFVQSRITNGEASITGTFTQEQAEQLANQLRFGALPLSLEVQSNQQISATLGADQLEKGLIAGLIGLLLVFIYSLFQYRALGLVTIASLIIVGLTTVGVISLLSWGIGYRLSLAGVAGLIIAIGVTADSFIVYFERIRDELRDGRSLQSAVDHAWRRARRTILASDAVSLLAAVTLYTLAVGGVRGFAFTLGLTTFLDLLAVFLFTHPVMVLLARTKFFGEGHRWSGLDPRQLGRETLYKGRGRVRSGAPVSTDGLTLAERKAAARRSESGDEPQEASAVVGAPAIAEASEAPEPLESDEKGDAR